MIGKWFETLKNYIFGENEEHQSENTIKQRQAPSGRVNDSKRVVVPKMLHRYPEGKFRFPVIPDQSKNPQQNARPVTVNKSDKKATPKYKQASDQHINQETIKREKFSGQNFKAREIPSPVYGFGERRLIPAGQLKDTYDVLEITNEEEVFSGNEHFDNEHLKEEPTTQPDPNIDVERDLVEITTEQEETVDEKVSTDETTLGISNTPNEPEVEHTPKKKETEQLHSHHKKSSNRQEEKRSHRRTVPFNVMMLKKDRNHLQKNQHQMKSKFPPLHLLKPPAYSRDNGSDWLDSQQDLLQSTLQNFNVNATVIGAVQGPSVTRLEVQPLPGVKVSKITNLSDDIKLSLSAKDIRIEAPIPGRNAVGIEVPNLNSRPVMLREIIESIEFRKQTSPLTVALGLDISGNPVVTDLQKMPHGLIAGATGSGKSVCINSILISLFYKASPDEVKLLLVDPKMVELAPYNKLPHLVTPVITDAKEATNALKWIVQEMERRYEEFSTNGVRDIKRYNEVATSQNKEKMPYIVVIIDELADLMMVSPQDVEEAISRIAQKARACGIHLLLATQRPSVDVITGLIKANIPTRIAFSVSSQVDSRTIIDAAGAEKLLGKGDMLFLGNGFSKPQRIQGTFVSDQEIEQITSFIREQQEPNYLFEKEVLVQNNAFEEMEDDLFAEACEFVLSQGAASSSALQRRFRIGFNRAARLIEMMEAKGIVSESMGSKPRSVLISKEELVEHGMDG